jgi:hypothetical protein
MKLLILLLPLWVVGVECAAQQSQPAGVDVNVSPVAKRIPDSVRQAVHQLYKRGRLFSTVGGVSGVVVASSGIVYLVKGAAVWQPGIDLLLGGGAVWAGVIGRTRYSRHQERKALSALEQGYPLPLYVAELVPLLPKRNRQIVLSSL